MNRCQRVYAKKNNVSASTQLTVCVCCYGAGSNKSDHLPKNLKAIRGEMNISKPLYCFEITVGNVTSHKESTIILTLWKHWTPLSSSWHNIVDITASDTTEYVLTALHPPPVAWKSSFLRTWLHSTPPPLLPQCPWPSKHCRSQGRYADSPKRGKQNNASGSQVLFW